MPIPLPTDDAVLLTRPDAGEVATIARGCASVAMPPTGLSTLQRVLLEAMCLALTDHRVDLSAVEPLPVPEFALALAPRNLAFRTRIVQVALLPALVLRPLPPEVVDRICALARELSVDESMIRVARDFSTGALALAAVDFERNGYTSHWHPHDAHELHTATDLASPWDVTLHDADLAARWGALELLPPDSLGRRVWELYRARAFTYPGLPGSAPPLLAQHDWVHVLADYGTTVEAELETFGLISRANDDMRAFSLLAMVVSLFETGYMANGAGLFEASPGHLSSDTHVATRLADALRRGALCHNTVTGEESVDFLRVDWFELADLPLDEARARFHVVPKSADAISAGSVGPRDPGGISPFQFHAGQQLADQLGVPYDSYGATPL